MTEEALTINNMLLNPVHEFLLHKYSIGIYKATPEDLERLENILGVKWGGTDHLTKLFGYYTSQPGKYIHGYGTYVVVGGLSEDIPVIHFKEFFSKVEKPLNITQNEVMELFT